MKNTLSSMCKEKRKSQLGFKIFPSVFKLVTIIITVNDETQC